MRRLLRLYRRSFAGLSPEIWWLSLVMLINRSGMMVMPFFTLYLTEARGYSLADTGYIMIFFGLGAIAGSYIGGLLVDRLDPFRVQVGSLLLTGLGFFGLLQLSGFWSICAGLFVLTTIADAFRPANYAAIAAYSRPETRTRSLSLVRLAVNLGISIGPAVGGALAQFAGYEWLFGVDGLTCLLAAGLLFWRLHPDRVPPPATPPAGSGNASTSSVWADRPFLLFSLGMLLVVTAFFQIIYSWPVFYRTELALSELQIGLFFTFNGLLIALIEMPVVFLTEKRWSNLGLTATGAVGIAASMLVFNVGGFTVLVAGVSMFFITISEIVNFPYSNAYTVARAGEGRTGAYLGLYTTTFAVAHLLAPPLGLPLAESHGFAWVWWVNGGLGLLGAALIYAVRRGAASQRGIDFTVN